jgi:hypothetical protein
MSCNTLCPCISSAWEQYFKILHNLHFYHVIWHHNAFCNIFIWKMSVCVCCDINMLIWTWQQQKFNLMSFALKSNKTCFSNHLLTLFLFLRLYQPKKRHISKSQILVIIYQGLYKNHSFIIRRSCDRIHINEIWIEFVSQSRSWINIKKNTKKPHKQIKMKTKQNVKSKNKAKIIMYTVTFRGIVNVEKIYCDFFFRILSLSYHFCFVNLSRTHMCLLRS